MLMKMRLFNFLFACLGFFPLALNAQAGVIVLENPSFEGIPSEGKIGSKLPDGWYDCGFPGETPPDLHPQPDGGAFQVTMKASDGKTYLGLVTRDNDTWEMVSQRLSQPLLAGNVYSFSLDLCRSLTYISASRSSNQAVNYATPVTLRIWGGKGYCEKDELLATSPLILNHDWKKIAFEFAPMEDYRYLVFEVFFKEKATFPYNGNLLMDNASNIVKL